MAGEGGGGLLVIDGDDDLLEAGDGIEGAGELLGDQVLVDTWYRNGGGRGSGRGRSTAVGVVQPPW